MAFGAIPAVRLVLLESTLAVTQHDVYEESGMAWAVPAPLPPRCVLVQVCGPLALDAQPLCPRLALTLRFAGLCCPLMIVIRRTIAEAQLLTTRCEFADFSCAIKIHLGQRARHSAEVDHDRGQYQCTPGTPGTRHVSAPPCLSLRPHVIQRCTATRTEYASVACPGNHKIISQIGVLKL